MIMHGSIKINKYIKGINMTLSEISKNSFFGEYQILYDNFAEFDYM
jgi:hypothetical protein